MSDKNRPLQQLSSNAISAKELARSLGLVKKTPSSSSSRQKCQEKDIKQRQYFTYLIVLDFESTCWKDKKLNYGPEIIEFPAVLLNTSTGELESEFHMFVQPTEHAKLSEFCRKLTGITQAQVDDGIPIGTCLMLFGRWLQEMKDKKGFKFPCEKVQSKDQENTTESVDKWCTFVTWSGAFLLALHKDWDLGTCLKNECYRKQLRIPHPLRSWLDLRATYKEFYSRKPQGLAGALQDLGIKFSGREHSGLDDARNTAHLTWRMICDGCIMKLTKSLDGMLEKLCKVVTQSGLSKSDPNKIMTTEHSKTSNDTVTKLTTSGANFHESLNFSKVQTEKHMDKNGNVGFGWKQNTAVKSKIVGSGDGHPCDKSTVIKDQNHVMKIQENEDKTAENHRVMAAVPGLKRRALQAMGNVASINICPDNKTGCGSAPKCLITPSTSLSSLSKRTRECYGEIRSETPRSAGLLLKRGLVKQTLSDNYQTPLGHRNRQMSLEGRQSKSETANQPCKPSNIEPRVATVPSLSIQENPASVPDGQQQKQGLNKNVKLDKPALASCTTTVSKGQNSLMCFNKPFTTPMGKPRPFTPPSVGRTKLNSPATPPIVSFNGGGVTPPLCECGRRTRRRSVVNPGPNQGRAFFACSLNHGRRGLGSSVGNKKSKDGCNFFRWEVNL